MSFTRKLALAAAVALVALSTTPIAGAQSHEEPEVTELVTFAGLGSGSTVGPDGALYVTDGPGGQVLRIDPDTGATSTYASGLPPTIIDVGGAMDVAFIGHKAYVLVTLVGPFFGQADVVNGIYRIGKDGSPTPVADIGTWSIENPPTTDFFVPSGVQYAMQRYGGGFLVTDGHHNRVLEVTKHGGITEVATFGNIVPTGLELSGRTVYVGEAGPVPHVPADGKVVSFSPSSPTPTEVASGAPLIVDVEMGHGRLHALSQGIWDLPVIPENEGLPASANTGSLVVAEPDGTFTTVVEGLDRPTSLEFIGDSAYVVTLTGKVLEIH